MRKITLTPLDDALMGKTIESAWEAKLYTSIPQGPGYSSYTREEHDGFLLKFVDGSELYIRGPRASLYGGDDYVEAASG